jgi:hypothetical protein
MSNPSEPFRAVFDLSLDALIVTLKEAQDYLGAGNDLAAIGTLRTLDSQIADLNAALRLFIATKRRNP